jgi:dihydrofolate synthase / folylpolyglutamate synthase
MMRYDEALAYLLAPTDPAKPVVARPDAGLNLPRMHQLLDLLGAPDQRYPAIVVAGTKGKGSTAALLAALFRAAGLRTGLYSQPHLHDYRERVRVAGKPISQDELVATTAELQAAIAGLAATPALGQPSTYDLGTALALAHFARAGVEIAVLEVGLGGRYDSVNTIVPIVSVITSISIDHTAVLGDTIEQIAGEKAGIIKPGVPVIVQGQRPAAWAVITTAAAAAPAPFIAAEAIAHVQQAAQQPDPLAGRQALAITVAADFPHGGVPARQFAADLALLGEFQRPNVATALAAALLAADHLGLSLDDATLARGLAAARWPGRLEIVRRVPLTIVDGAHNVDSAAHLRQALHDLFPGRPLILVLGTSLDKDIAGIMRELVPAAAQVILTVSAHPRSASLDRLRQDIARYDVPVEELPTVGAALDRATTLAGPDALICATGSLFVVADARAHFGLGDEAVAV